MPYMWQEKEFLKTECTEQLSRVLRHDIRSSDLNNVQNGDEVFYKRVGSNEWLGPRIVIGRDGKQVLVRHGGVYVRVHVCRLTRDHSTQCKGVMTEDKGIEMDSNKRVSSNVIVESDESDDKALVEADGTQEPEKHSETQEHLKVKVGQRVQGVHKVSGELRSGRILSRAGKATGKYKDCCNIKWDSDSSEGWADVRSNFSDLQVLDETVEMMVLFNSEDVLCAKKKKIKSWQDNDVYKEVDNVGQDALSVRCVVTEKMKNNQPVIKARLVLRGFEEDIMKLKKLRKLRI